MTFNSWTFAAFFLAILGVYYSVQNWRYRKAALLVGSYVFYAAWNPVFVPLLMASTFLDWLVGLALFRVQSQTVRRILLCISLVSNLGILCFFKYGEFITNAGIQLLSAAGIHYERVYWGLILPVGISFYIFQTLSYIIDVYRRSINAERSLLDYSLFVTFFPQLVAGPIVRAGEFLPQLATPKAFEANAFLKGLFLILVGVALKNVADNIFAPYSDELFATTRVLSVVAAWTAATAFGGQIYCDFAGYSTCAIGAALCLGFALPENFRYPYAAIGFSDFWRRWHISLSRWLRDYLYIPLGGNRLGFVRTNLNLFITMFLGGLWHGASWVFAIWGILHGAFLAMERLGVWWIERRGFNRVYSSRPWLILYGTITFACVSVGWVFFRAPSLERARAILRSMSGFGREAHWFDDANDHRLIIAICAVLLLVTFQIFMRARSFISAIDSLGLWSRTAIIAILVYFLFVSSSDDRSFIYFQF